MRLVMSPQAIAVVRLPADVPDPEWARGGPLVSVTRTQRETSVIVPTSSVPEDVPGPVQGPLVGVYVDELLDFSQVGILVGLLKPLADAGIPVLTVSTYDTDWVLVEASKAAAASSVWRAAGYQVIDAARREAEDAENEDAENAAAENEADHEAAENEADHEAVEDEADATPDTEVDATPDTGADRADATPQADATRAETPDPPADTPREKKPKGVAALVVDVRDRVRTSRSRKDTT